MAKGSKKAWPKRPMYANSAEPPPATGMPPELAELLKNMGADATQGFAFGSLALSFAMKLIADFQEAADRRNDRLATALERIAAALEEKRETADFGKNALNEGGV